MNREVYLSRKETATRKANGQFKRGVIEKMSADLREAVEIFKLVYYTSPAWYGIALANRPRNKHGKRVYHVTNF